MRARIFTAGFCTGPGKIADKALSWGRVEFPAPYALIEHPEKGRVMFDTGYHPRFYECTDTFPERILALSTPCFVSDPETAKSSLEQIDIDASSVGHMVLSHLHADHIAGVCDFSQATFYCDPGGWQFINRTGRLAGAKKGYLPKLLPGNFAERTIFSADYPVAVSKLLECAEPPTELWANDLFDDGLIYVVNLPGHAIGHVGLLCRLTKSWLFLLADACWLKDNLYPGHEPHALAAVIFDDSTAFNQTLSSLKHLYQHTGDSIDFVPSHCKKTVNTIVGKGWMS